MNILPRILILCLALIVIPLSASAQVAGTIRPSLQKQDRSHIANPYYDHSVRQAMLHMAPTFDFRRLRALYGDTSQYDPIGEETVNKMQELAFIVQEGTDQEERAQAIEEYRNLVMQHMGNLRVVVQALAFAKLDSAFGNPKFFIWLRSGLVRALIAQGDGKTVKSAYYVITLSEETVLLGKLGVNVINTTVADQGTLFYNMHEVEDLKTGQKRTVFVNTTHPMMYLRTKQALEGKGGFSILRQ